MKTIVKFGHLGACAMAAAVLALPAAAAEPPMPASGTQAAEVPAAAAPAVGAPAAESPASRSPIDTVARLAPSAVAEAAGTPHEASTWAVGGETVRALDHDRLEQARGRADTVLNDTKLNGDVASNSAVNVQTGSNTIDAGSFANMSGIPVVIQNSGANVLIQNATVVNLQFQ